MNLTIPELCLVVLAGPSGSGKSSFARKHFAATEVISSDYCRALVSDDENDQAATADAFDTLNFIAGKRLARGKLTVVDATSVRPEDRAKLVQLARSYHVLPVIIALNLDPKVCLERNRSRTDRAFGDHVVHQQSRALRRSLKRLKREGFRNITVLESPEEIESITIERQKLWTDKRDQHGPFDLIGDIHGCFDETVELLETLGYSVNATPEQESASHPEGRQAIFLGDLVDRGPNSPAVLRLVMSMVESGSALCVPGNHDVKLMKKLFGRDVKLTHGLAETMEQLEGASEEFTNRITRFVDGLVSHLVLDDGKLVCAHAGMKQEFIGRASKRIREFALYGETTGETDEFGLPVRFDWASEYRGDAMVVYGHTPVPQAEWINRTICLDTGCVFGGKLTALRYPERELVEVDARKMYYEPIKPLNAPLEDAERGDLLDIADVTGKRVISTRHFRSVTIREENAIAALEVMSRFAVDPHWLIYLPPTMSPSETCKSGEYLEHPSETFAAFKREEIPNVICQEKHMGSRAVVMICKDNATAKKRFGISGDESGVIVTRTGRAFFGDDATRDELLARLRSAIDRAGFWERFDTDWFCFDAELMPWSAKAQDLLRAQYAPVGSAAIASLSAASELLARTAQRLPEAAAMGERIDARLACARDYREAYRQYCWEVASIADFKLAPFHLLASEGHVHIDRDHQWHMETLAELCAADPELLHATAHRIVNLNDEASVQATTDWWLELTGKGGEGMVVKPLNWINKGRKGLVQPALKCRGREYLRIIYGPEYTLPDQLERLRARGLSRKRSLALREFALGMEALHRFVDHEPLYRVHECTFGVLAMESEPVDPRL